MRELLFKGKRKDTGEWTEGYFFKIWDRVFLLWGMTGDSPNMEEVIPETVEQCTGLSEKAEEIKKALQDHSIEKLKYQDGIKIKELDFFDILTYINELENDNERLSKENFVLYRDRFTKKELDDISACRVTKATQALKEQLNELLNRKIEPKIFHCHADASETCPKVQQAVKEFAEKLKKRLNLGLYEWQYAEVDSKTIDELLKEYIDEE